MAAGEAGRWPVVGGDTVPHLALCASVSSLALLPLPFLMTLNIFLIIKKKGLHFQK